MRRSALQSALLGAVLVQLAVTAAAEAGCEYKLWRHSQKLSTANRLGHSTGKHQAVFSSTFTCVCDHTCRSTCTPTIDESVSRCTDSGILKGVFIHRQHVKSAIKAGSKANATSGGGADCGTGYGCFIQECRPFFCSSFPIEVSFEPARIGIAATFTTTLKPLWDGQLNMPWECDECWTSEEVTDQLRRMGQEYQDVDSIDSGGSSGSSSPWYSTCRWECWSRMDSAGRYTEYCELVDCVR